MSSEASQRAHYDELVRRERPTRWGMSCGFRDRYDPALLERRPALRRALGSLFARALPTEVETVLDLGCGTAYYWPLLGPRCRRLLGLELSPEMAGCGQRHRRASPLGEVLVGEVGRLPVASASVEVVLAVDVLHHLSDLPLALEEVCRVLAPGGRLVAIEPNVCNPMVTLAHLVPPEERGALYPNHPVALRRALRRAFAEVRVAPVTYVSGIESAAALRLVERLVPLFERPPLSLLSLRRLYVAASPRGER